jgi:transcriptional regulator of arginine metabolism
VKHQRLDAIRDLLSRSLVSSQDELRRKLRRRGIHVTQATLSRDMHELRLSKGPGGYSLPNGPRGGNGHGANGHGAAATVDAESDAPPSVEEMLNSLGLRVCQALNQVVVSTVLGGAQPVAAALDRAGWPEVVGTIAGDDTVLVICPDVRRAGDVQTRIRTLLEA